MLVLESLRSLLNVRHDAWNKYVEANNRWQKTKELASWKAMEIARQEMNEASNEYEKFGTMYRELIEGQELELRVELNELLNERKNLPELFDDTK